MEHQSLCSATGIPHSTQIRTRCTGSFDPNSFLRNVIAPLPGCPPATVARRGYYTIRLTSKNGSRFARSCGDAKKFGLGGFGHGLRRPPRPSPTLVVPLLWHTPPAL